MNANINVNIKKQTDFTYLSINLAASFDLEICHYGYSQ